VAWIYGVTQLETVSLHEAGFKFVKGPGMVEPNIFNPNIDLAECEAYLSHSLKSQVRIVHAEPLRKSTRDAPLRLDVEVDGVMRRYVLRLDARRSEHEYAVLRAMESIPILTPNVYGWDPEGEALGVPCFLCDFVEGESLLEPMLEGERWAEELYIDTVCTLQEISREQLSTIKDRVIGEETAEGVLEAAHEYFKVDAHQLAKAVYEKLKKSMPKFPAVRFSNGDLWLENIITRDRQLAGIIDFENAGFSDPIYEFLLPFFVSPGLRGRGIEGRYCERMGFDADLLSWYRGLEYFDTWYWVEATGKPFEHYTSENLQVALESWLDEE
jgi:aminoglycoside phosphotransferase (APT) family kinase protein